jgi:Arc/MetJ family transcription regulator
MILTYSTGGINRPFEGSLRLSGQRQPVIIYIYIYITAIGLTPGGSSTPHIYTQTVQQYSTHLHTNSTAVHHTFTHKQYSSTPHIYTQTVQQYITHLHTNSTAVHHTFTHKQYTKCRKRKTLSVQFTERIAIHNLITHNDSRFLTC